MPVDAPGHDDVCAEGVQESRLVKRRRSQSKSPHCAQSLQVMQAPEAHRTSEHRQVKWPQARKDKEWLQFDKDIDTILEATAKGEAGRRLKTITTVIISLAVERFWQEDKRIAKPPTP